MVFISAADHHIPDREQFNRAVFDARSDAESGYLVAFGIEPKFASTEFGYIKSSTQIRPKGSNLIEKFVEKPDPATAAGYIKSGYLWNSGNFMFRASVLLDEYRNVDADSVRVVSDAVTKAGRDLGFVTLDPDSYQPSSRPPDTLLGIGSMSAELLSKLVTLFRPTIFLPDHILDFFLVGSKKLAGGLDRATTAYVVSLFRLLLMPLRCHSKVVYLAGC